MLDEGEDAGEDEDSDEDILTPYNSPPPQMSTTFMLQTGKLNLRRSLEHQYVDCGEARCRAAVFSVRVRDVLMWQSKSSRAEKEQKWMDSE